MTATMTSATPGDWRRTDAALGVLRTTLGDITALSPQERRALPELLTLSGYGRALLKARGGDRYELDLLNRAMTDMAIAGGEMGRLVSHGVSSDSTLAKPLLDGVVAFVDASRPSITRGANRLEMPTNPAPSFTRSVVTQPTNPDVQGAEGDVASSIRYQTSGTTVAKQEVAFAAALSEQLLEFSGDHSLDDVARDVSRQYAKRTAKLFCSALESAVTDTDVLATNATPDVVMATLAGALPDFVAAAGVPPDVLFLSTARFAQLAALVDAQKRPIPPALIADSLGISNLVVDSQFADGTLLLGASTYLEFYEPPAQKVVSVAAPSTLEVIVSFSSAVATFTPAEALHGFTTS